MYTQCQQNIIVPLPKPLKENLRRNFDSKYKFPSGISWQIFFQDWCRYLDTDPPTPPTVRAIFSRNQNNGKNCCQYRIADGLCQLLSKYSYDEWINQLREEMEKNFSAPDFCEINQSIEVKEQQNTDQTKISTTSTPKWEIHLEADQELADAIFAFLKAYRNNTS